MNKPRRKIPKTRKPNLSKNSKFLTLYSVLMAVLGTSSLAIYLTLKPSDRCQIVDTKELGFQSYKPKVIPEQIKQNQSLCYQFQVQENQKISLSTNHSVILETSSNKPETFQGNKSLEIPGTYKLTIQNNQKEFKYEMILTLTPSDRFSPVSQLPQSLLSIGQPQTPKTVNYSPLLTPPLTPLLTKYSTQLAYNINQSPSFHENKKLNKIVDDIVSLARSRGLPTYYLSISLVNLKQSQCCGYAGYHQDQSSYPASIVKLFWLVAFYSQKNQQGIPPEAIAPEDKKLLSKMIIDSDNESASAIVDKITDTYSTKEQLPKDQFNIWKANRDTLNKFFAAAGYENINISQKTFPIPKLLINPEGPDLQFRQINGTKAPPMRNKLTTDNVARLLYEIYQNKTISPNYSQEIMRLIHRNLDPNVWKEKPYDAVEEFLGEGIYELFSNNLKEVQVYSKMGWTFNNRNDSAIIVSPEAKYILVIFGDHPKYYQDKKFLPLLSQKVYQQIKQIPGN